MVPARAKALLPAIAAHVATECRAASSGVSAERHVRICSRRVRFVLAISLGRLITLAVSSMYEPAALSRCDA